MEISFDPEKRRRTLERRGLDFADAGAVFVGPAVEFEDVRFAYPERRFATYGLLDDRMVALVWTEAANGRRVISMRKAMSEKAPTMDPGWLDPADDAPEMTDELFEIAELSIGGKVIRPATGYLGPNGVVRGRPPQRARAKQQVTLRLDPDVVERFRADGPGWQGRMNEALRKAVGL